VSRSYNSGTLLYSVLLVPLLYDLLTVSPTVILTVFWCSFTVQRPAAEFKYNGLNTVFGAWHAWVVAGHTRALARDGIGDGRSVVCIPEVVATRMWRWIYPL